MKTNGQTVEESIRQEAYLLSEKAGHPASMDGVFWMQAELIVHQRIASEAVTAVSGAAAPTPPANPASAGKKIASKRPAPEPPATKEAGKRKPAQLQASAMKVEPVVKASRKVQPAPVEPPKVAPTPVAAPAPPAKPKRKK